MEYLSEILLRVDQKHVSQAVLYFFDDSNVKYLAERSAKDNIVLSEKEVVDIMVRVFRDYRLHSHRDSNIRRIITTLNKRTFTEIQSRISKRIAYEKFKTKRKPAFCSNPINCSIKK